MTFCGDLLFVPSGIHHHLFENLRRKGHHCHGLTHLSWAERKIFYRVLGKKFCGLFIYPGQSVRQVVAVSAPGDRGLNRCMAPDTTTGRHPPQRREARFAKRRCSLHPGVFLPGCQERRSRRDKGGATVPVAANPGFCVRDGSPPGGRPGKAQAEEEQDRQESEQQ
ncbi:hypothetical protein BvCmsSIP019_01272 [Escherichia coli]|nr:hypothetical protein BvCmsSIP019_01272 [Escherichia coli]